MDDNSSISEELLESTILEENARIRTTITSWAQGKVTKDVWEALRELFNNLSIRTHLDAGELKYVIKCFCDVNYNISKFSKRGLKSKRWIYSNFQTHLFKKHIQNTNSPATKCNEKSRITYYVSKAPLELPNAKILCNIKFANRANIEETSHINNEEDEAEVVNIAEVIDQAEIIFDTVNIIDTVEDIKNRITDTEDTKNPIDIVEDTKRRIIDSQKTMEEIDYSISDSSCVIDLDIDSDSTHTFPNSKINVSQCDKWKSMKYQRSERLKRA